METNFKNKNNNVNEKHLEKDTNQLPNHFINFQRNDNSKIDLELLIDDIRKTEEINDLIILDSEGKVAFFHSAQNTLDLEYLNNFKGEFEYFFIIIS